MKGSTRPRLAVVLDPGVDDGQHQRDRVAHLEDLGVDALYVGDHVAETAGPFATLGWLAGATSLHLGTYVACAPLRPVVESVREAIAVATLARRPVRLGLGAGWQIADLDAAGVDPAGAARHERVAEQLRAARTLLDGQPASGLGDRGWSTGAPLPGAADATVELALAASGPRMLELARAADVVALAPRLAPGRHARGSASGLSSAALEKKLCVLDAGPGRGPARSLLISVLRVGDRARLVDGVARSLGVASEVIEGSPHVLIGDAGWLVERVGELVDRYRLAELVVPEAAARRAGSVIRTIAGAR